MISYTISYYDIVYDIVYEMCITRSYKIPADPTFRIGYRMYMISYGISYT